MKKFLTILFVLNLVWIWGNSTLTSKKSNELSNIISNIVYHKVYSNDNKNNTENSNSNTNSNTNQDKENQTEPDTKDKQDVSYLIRNGDATIRQTVYITTIIVRKSAHLIEYMTLAIISTALLSINDKVNYKKIFNSFKIGICTAFIDETIQIFSGRTAAIKDIWIDTFGFSIGIFIILLFKAITYLIKLKKSKVS